MSAQRSVTPPQPAPAAPAIQFASPDHYQLNGNGISVTYTPISAGGVGHLEYQDTVRTLNFSGDKIRKVDLPDVGTIVSVTLALSIDAGSTTFSVLIPQVQLRNQLGASAFILHRRHHHRPSPLHRARLQSRAA